MISSALIYTCERQRTGPMIVACQLKRSSPVGPAEHDDGGSRPRSMSSLLMRLRALRAVEAQQHGRARREREGRRGGESGK